MTEANAILEELYQTIAARKGASPEHSYTASLYAGGAAKCARKVGEEAVETVIAALGEDDQALVRETADLIYHVLVLLAVKEVSLAAVLTELAARKGMSGLDEKAARKEP